MYVPRTGTFGKLVSRSSSCQPYLEFIKKVIIIRRRMLLVFSLFPSPLCSFFCCSLCFRAELEPRRLRGVGQRVLYALASVLILPPPPKTLQIPSHHPSFVPDPLPSHFCSSFTQDMSVPQKIWKHFFFSFVPPPPHFIKRFVKNLSCVVSGTDKKKKKTHEVKCRTTGNMRDSEVMTKGLGFCLSFT